MHKTNKQIQALVREQRKSVAKLSVKLNKRFVLDLNTLEKLYSIFSEIDGLEDGLTESIIEENAFFIVSAMDDLNLPCDLGFILNLYEVYSLSMNLFIALNDRLIPASNSSIGYEEIPSDQMLEFAKENKYKFKEIGKSSTPNIFYEIIKPFDLDNYQLLCSFDSVRSELIEYGDTIELIESRDFVLSLFKYYHYKTKGVTIGQTARN